MARFGLVGPSYTSQSINADSEQTMNFYVEAIEGQGKTAATLYPTPGTVVFCTLVTTDGLPASIRGIISINGRTFAVCGTNFYEILSNGTTIIRGTVLNNSKQVSMAAGLTQLLIASSGSLYVFTYASNAFVQVNASNLLGVMTQVVWLDGFFVALLDNSSKFQVSALEDATSWDLTQVAEVSVFPDNVLGMKVLHREIWMMGVKASTVYYDSGNIFPFDVNSSAGVIEMGIAAPLSQVILDNTIFWLGNDERGFGIVWRASAYTPARVSNHAIEFAMQGYSTISDAVGYGYQDQGHSFYVLYFPTANHTWVYDVATGLWHERGFWNARAGVFTAHRSQCHTSNFGKHLVGDWESGNIYQMAIPVVSGSAWAFATDFGNPIKRVRRSPHISNEQTRMFHHQLQIDLESGLGPMPPLKDGFGNTRGPILSVRFSDDGGHTWSNQQDLDCGQAGEYRKRVILWRLGISRDRVYEISGADPVPYRIVDGYVLASTGFDVQERITTQARKVS